jgi:hypothetical protein
MLSEAVLKLQPHATNSTNLLFAQVNGGNGIGLQVTNGPATANWDLALSPFGGNVGIGIVSPSGKLHVNGDIRGTIFYDSDNTGYYVNPAGISNMSSIALKGSTYSSGVDSVTDAALIIDRGFRIYNDDGSYLRSILQFDTSAQINIGQGGTALISSVNLLPGNAGYVYAANSFRSPIFYDSNDTSYYCNPASASNLNQARFYAGISVNSAASSTSKHGISLHGTQTTGMPAYGLAFTGTAGSGTHGSVTSDWATYFTMNGSTSRGWIFKHGTNLVASISGTGNAHFNGDVVAYSSSDERLKDNKKNINNALEKVESLNGVEFDWNDKQDVYEGHDIGVIAQEVEKIAPELVSTRDNGYKAVKYEKLVPLLIEAIKELSDKVKALENK